MILHDISDIELTIDKYLELENGGFRKIRGRLDGELQIGEFAYIGQSENKIKRLSEDEYIFIRKDGVNTHIEKSYCGKDLDAIHKEINKKLNYNIKFADDRVKLVEYLLSQNEWIYSLISTNKLMEKEIKKKNSFLAENQKYDKIIDSISTYITHAKFKNKEDEEYHLKLQQEKLKLEQKDKRKKTPEEFDKLNYLIDEIQNFHHKLVKKKFQSDNGTEFVGDLSQRESKGDFTYQEELKDRTKKAKFPYHKDEIPKDYWLKMYPQHRKELIPFYDIDLHDESKNKSIHHYDFRPVLLKQMKTEVEKLHKYLGLHIKDKLERLHYVENLKNKLENMMWQNISGIRDDSISFEDVIKQNKVKPKNYDEIKYISGDRQYQILKQMYIDLKADYELAKKKLTDEFYFEPAKHSTIYSIDSNTWYENENGEIVELSKNLVSMADANTYKGLILNYKDLKDKYIDKPNSDWWALIKDFEDILSKTEFTEEEQFVLDVLFDGYSQKQIKEKYKEFNNDPITKDKISRLINQQIPNKLLNTYLTNIDDWLYTEKIKGKYKKCSKCEKVKLISNDRYFNKDSSRKDGFMYICKECEKV